MIDITNTIDGFQSHTLSFKEKLISELLFKRKEQISHGTEVGTEV